MQAEDDAATSRCFSLNSKTFACSTVFGLLLVIFIIMSGATIILVALTVLGMSAVTEVQTAHVKLSVFYESLCPDSRRFIINQLYPTLEKLGGTANKYLEAEFVPYGKATTELENGEFKFECQHGPQECEGNVVHACALAKYSPADAAAFINCSMAVFNSPITDPGCASSLGLNYTKVEECANKSWEGKTLLAANGIRTHDLQPTLYYVPWILIDNEFTTENLDLAQRNLMGLLCGKLGAANATVPPECSERMH